MDLCDPTPPAPERKQSNQMRSNAQGQVMQCAARTRLKEGEAVVKQRGDKCLCRLKMNLKVLPKTATRATVPSFLHKENKLLECLCCEMYVCQTSCSH